MKKTLVILLAIVMLFSVSTFAASAEGNSISHHPTMAEPYVALEEEDKAATYQ